MPPDPLALACFACWACFAHLHHQKGPLFLEKNLPTLSSAYGPAKTRLVLGREIQESLIFDHYTSLLESL